jgi:hypothetical protein
MGRGAGRKTGRVNDGARTLQGANCAKKCPEDRPMKAHPLAAALMLVLFSASAFASVDDADEAKVASCTFVKDVSAPTSKGKHTREALGAAMETARKDADKAGATHIVWNKIKAGADASSVSGKAYRCDK